MKKYICILLSFLGNLSFAQIKTQLTSEKILIGDTVTLKIEVQVPRNAQIIFPSVRDSLGKYIEVLSQKTDTIETTKDKKYIKTYRLTCFEEGDYMVKALPFNINGKTFLSHAQLLNVESVPVDTVTQKIYPIKNILLEEISWWDQNKKYFWYMIVGGIMLLALITVAWLYIRESKRERYISKPALPPFEEAIENLKKLDHQAYLENKDYDSYYTDLSFILRRYFSRRFAFPAQALLSSDLPRVMEQKGHLIGQEARELQAFLEDADKVKYAKKEIPENKHQPHRMWVQRIIEKTRPIMEEIKDHI